MSSFRDPHAARNHADEPTEELRVADWLGLARYLADAVGADDVTVDLVREELADVTYDRAETRALRRAATIAATQNGDDALVTTVLRSAASDATTRRDVA